MDISDPVAVVLIVLAIAIILAIVLAVYCFKKCCKKTTSDQRRNERRYLARPASNSAQVREGNSLDLHGYYRKDAHNRFKGFLSAKEEEYKKSGKKSTHRFINVITGQGKHSKDGVPVIKNMTEEYLRSHGYKYQWDYHGGMVTIDLNNSLF